MPAPIRENCLHGRAGSGRRVLAGLTAWLLAFGIAGAVDASEPDGTAETIDRVIETVILPAHATFRATAEDQQAAMTTLCATPGAAQLDAARAGFADLVGAFSRIEMFRFGPARRDNRFERLFFWPDRRGRALRQVQGLIAGEDETALTVDTLRGKSVAVQGLPALDYVLSGTGSDGLADGTAPYRCRYGLAVAGAIAATADEIDRDWQQSDGYAALMRAPGPDNSVYRSSDEVVEDLLQAAGEQIQIVHDLKLVAVIGETPDKARPKRAPFWRSDLALVSMVGNIDGVRAVHDAALAPLLPDDQARLARALDFELDQTRAALDRLGADERAWLDLMADPETHATLSYAGIPLGGAMALLGTRYPAALGLTLGFNSLDGD